MRSACTPESPFKFVTDIKGKNIENKTIPPSINNSFDSDWYEESNSIPTNEFLIVQKKKNKSRSSKKEKKKQNKQKNELNNTVKESTQTTNFFNYLSALNDNESSNDI